MQNKKALSALVATVLLVLITVAVIGLIWGAIIPMITTGMEEATAKQECLKTGVSIKLEGTGFTPAAGLSINIGREESTANISKILVKAIGPASDSQTFTYTTIPPVFGSLIYKNNSAITLSGVSKVDALAYVKVGTKEYPCASVGEVAI
jgi:FlaG/FlaF family flagellin (archaellin)